MPIIRKEIHDFVKTWNVHSIRNQPKRPNAVTGQPIVNYHWPKGTVRDCGFIPDTDLLAHLKEQVADWGKGLLDTCH
jgi:hypothetical protein